MFNAARRSASLLSLGHCRFVAAAWTSFLLLQLSRRIFSKCFRTFSWPLFLWTLFCLENFLRKAYSWLKCMDFVPNDFGKKTFSKTVHTIFIKFCTVILHPKGPLRAQWHQNRMTGIWVTKPKLTQNWSKTAIFALFRFSQILFMVWKNF